MSFLSRTRAEWGPLDDRWYQPLTNFTVDSGVVINAETVLRCGTVLAALRFKAESFAMCPPKVYRELPGDRKQADRDHYLFALLRRPNAWQTGFQWRALQQMHLGLYGNAFNRIVAAGPGNPFSELRPLDPERMKGRQETNGRLVYQYTPPNGVMPETLAQDEVLHFRGLSVDGYSGVVTYQLMRNVVGIALSAEKHAGVFLRKGTRVSGVLSTKELLPKETRERAEESWRRAFAGPDNEGAVAMVGAGLEFKPISMDHRNAQFLELRDFQVGEILRFLGVPGVVVGYADKTATYASAEAFFDKGGIKHCLLPTVLNMEEEIDANLLLEGDPHYCKFTLDALLRANTKDRYEALFRASGRPWMTGNEVRRIEDLDPIDDDPTMDQVAQAPGTAASDPGSEQDEAALPPPPGRPEPEDDEESEASAARARRMEQFARDAAARVVRREVAAIVGSGGQVRKPPAERFAADPSGWSIWVTDYYEKHAGHVAEVLRLNRTTAAAYAHAQRDELLAGGVKVVETWEERKVPLLTELALSQEV